jgi:hypothetical protein
MRNERSRLRTGIAALVALLAGSGLLFLSQVWRNAWYGRLLNDLGSIIIASIALVLIFDFWQKEAFFNELFASARSAAELKASGIVGFSSSFQDNVDWEEFFGRSTHLDIVFAYGSTWRNTHLHRLERLLARDKAKVNVALPDPECSVLIQELAFRFGTSADDLRSKILDAVSFFSRLAEKFPGKVKIFQVARSYSYSFYRFNNDAVVAFYTFRPERTAIPTLLATRGGGLYEFVRSEWYSLLEEGIKAGYTRELSQPVN